MASRFASEKNAISICDRCGRTCKLKLLRKLTVKTKLVNIRVCPECWEPDQPQLSLGLYPIDDPQALRNPRPDSSYVVSGLNIDGTPSPGCRPIQWGWKPVGGSSANDAGLTPNALVLQFLVSNVTVTTA